MSDFQIRMDDMLYAQYVVARGLIAYMPYSFECNIGCRKREIELGIELKHGWRKIIYPDQTEEGLETPSPVFTYLGGLDGKCVNHLPADELLVATLQLQHVSTLRASLVWFVQSEMPGDPRDDVPAGMSERVVRRIRNSLLASEPTRCKKMLRRFRSALLQHGPVGCVDPTILGSARDHVNSMRTEFGADVHLPSALTAIVDFLGEIDQHRSEPGKFNVIQNLQILRPLFDERIQHPNQLLNEIIAVAVSMGFVREVRLLADRYRDATSTARVAAIEAQDHESMISTLFEALPRVKAANDIYQTLRMLKNDLPSESSDVIEGIARSTDEELVRFINAFSIQFSHLFLEGINKDLEMIKCASELGPEAIGQIRTVLEGQFSYPKVVLDGLLGHS